MNNWILHIYAQWVTIYVLFLGHLQINDDSLESRLSLFFPPVTLGAQQHGYNPLHHYICYEGVLAYSSVMSLSS